MGKKKNKYLTLFARGVLICVVIFFSVVAVLPNIISIALIYVYPDPRIVSGNHTITVHHFPYFDQFCFYDHLYGITTLNPSFRAKLAVDSIPISYNDISYFNGMVETFFVSQICFKDNFLRDDFLTREHRLTGYLVVGLFNVYRIEAILTPIDD
jgi:hypothetical protein